MKARHFVLGLRDYFVEKYGDHGHNIGGESTNAETPARQVVDSDNNTLDPTVPLSRSLMKNYPRGMKEDSWALDYISILRVQSILEALDDDGSGFVSVKEANDFTAARPIDWR